MAEKGTMGSQARAKSVLNVKGKKKVDVLLISLPKKQS